MRRLIKEWWMEIFVTLAILTILIATIFKELQEKDKYIRESISMGYRIITAYNPVHWQTDETPCQGALSGIDFCDTNLKLVATNELPLGSEVIIEGQTYLVADRMNNRYPVTYDILMSSLEEAKNFGRQELEVYLVVR